MVTKRTEKLIRVGSLISLFIFIGFALSQTVGLFLTGFESENILQQYSFYISGASFLIGAFILFLIELNINKDDKKYGDSVCINTPSDPPSLNIPFLRNPIGIFFLSISVFLIIGLFSIFRTSQRTFTGVGVLGQEFTPIGNLLFSGLLIPISENAGAILLIALVIFFVRNIARRIKMDKTTFRVLIYVLVPLLVGLYGIANHTLRYGDSELQLVTVFFFWSIIIGLLTVLTGTAIVGWIAHTINNVMFSLSQTVSFEQLLIPTVIISVLSFGLYLLTLFVFQNRKK